MAKKRADVMTGNAADWKSFADHPQWLKDRLTWFQDLKFGLFIHWGIYCQWNCIESWPLVAADTWARPDDLPCWRDRGRDLERFRRDYRALNKTFNPMAFAPEVWAEAAANAGMKYVCFTTKHHDGFCMFDTATTDYRITDPDCPFHSHPRANVVREVFDAFRARDFAVSCYFSKSDWHCPWYWVPDRPAPDRNPNFDTAAEPEIWEEFVRFVHAQVKELMTDYGPIDVLWLDGGQVRPPRQDIHMDAMVAMARQLQPGLIVADRTVGGAHENIITPEQEIPETPLVDQPWESCLTMGNGWSYRENDIYKPARKLIGMLVDIVAKGGNFLLNIGPSPSGEFAAEALQRLNEIGAWMAVNGEAIHGSRPLAPYASGALRFTRRGDTGYAIQLQGDKSVSPPQVLLPDVRLRPGSEVVLLGHADAVPWKATPAGVELTVPPIPPPADYAWVYRFILE